MPGKLTVTGRGSNAVRVIEDAWKLLRRVEPTIPAAVLTLVDARSRSRVLGYFYPETWKKRDGKAHEIALSPGLLSDPEQLLCTMLHEAAHAVLSDAGDRGGVTGRYYHRKEFRKQCVTFGLECEFRDTRYGFTITRWPDGVLDERYADVLAFLRRELPGGTEHPGARIQVGKKLPASGRVTLTCRCDPVRTIYAGRSTAGRSGIRCDFCGELFSELVRL